MLTLVQSLYCIRISPHPSLHFPRHTFKVNRDILLNLYQHTLEVRVWNSKEKLSARARYDRPKAFRLSAPPRRKRDKSTQHSEAGKDEKGESQSKEEDPDDHELANAGRPLRFLIVNHSSSQQKTKRHSKLSKLNLTAASEHLNASVGELEVTSPCVGTLAVIKDRKQEEGRGGEDLKDEKGTGGPVVSSSSTSLVPSTYHPVTS